MPYFFLLVQAGSKLATDTLSLQVGLGQGGSRTVVLLLGVGQFGPTPVDHEWTYRPLSSCSSNRTSSCSLIRHTATSIRWRANSTP